MAAESSRKPLVSPPGWELRPLASQYHEFDCTRRANGEEFHEGRGADWQWLQFQKLTETRRVMMKTVNRNGKRMAARVAGHSPAKSGRPGARFRDAIQLR
jgi:hypothetical protein